LSTGCFGITLGDAHDACVAGKNFSPHAVVLRVQGLEWNASSSAQYKNPLLDGIRTFLS
jgi:hypothetical protein